MGFIVINKKPTTKRPPPPYGQGVKQAKIKCNNCGASKNKDKPCDYCRG
jgi:hypothetical protein